MSPRAYVMSPLGDGHRNTVAEVLLAMQPFQPLENAVQLHTIGLVVIEDVDSSWEQAMQSTWKIPATFFDEHKTNPSGVDPWKAIFVRNVITGLPSRHEEAHISGVFEYPGWMSKPGASLKDGDFARRCWKPSGPHAISSTTKLSYTLVGSKFCMRLTVNHC